MRETRATPAAPATTSLRRAIGRCRRRGKRGSRETCSPESSSARPQRTVSTGHCLRLPSRSHYLVPSPSLCSRGDGGGGGAVAPARAKRGGAASSAAGAGGHGGGPARGAGQTAGCEAAQHGGGHVARLCAAARADAGALSLGLLRGPVSPLGGCVRALTPAPSYPSAPLAAAIDAGVRRRGRRAAGAGGRGPPARCTARGGGGGGGGGEKGAGG